MPTISTRVGSLVFVAQRQEGCISIGKITKRSGDFCRVETIKGACKSVNLGQDTVITLVEDVGSLSPVKAVSAHFPEILTRVFARFADLELKVSSLDGRTAMLDPLD